MEPPATSWISWVARPQGDGGQFRAQALFETLGWRRYARRKVSAVRRLLKLLKVADSRSTEAGGFGAYFAVGPAYDPAQANGVAGIGYDQHLGIQFPGRSVQGFQGLPRRGPPYDYGLVPNLFQVEGVQGLVELQHHVVGHVHHVAYGAQAGSGKPVLEPLGRRSYLQALDQAGGVPVAPGRGRPPKRWPRRSWAGRLRCRTGPRAPAPALPVRAPISWATPRMEKQSSTVGGDFQVKDGIAKIVVQGVRPEGRHSGRTTIPSWPVAQAQFQLGADHSLGDHARGSGRP